MHALITYFTIAVVLGIIAAYDAECLEDRAKAVGFEVTRVGSVAPHLWYIAVFCLPMLALPAYLVLRRSFASELRAAESADREFASARDFVFRNLYAGRAAGALRDHLRERGMSRARVSAVMSAEKAEMRGQRLPAHLNTFEPRIAVRVAATALLLLGAALVASQFVTGPSGARLAGHSSPPATMQAQDAEAPTSEAPTERGSMR